MESPDILVLAAGGVLGEAWMSGVLAGIEDAGALDLRRTRAFVGTSAGSIVAARLASGRSPRRPADTAAVAAAASEAAGAPSPLAALSALAPLAPAGLRLRRAPAALARSVLLRAAPSGTRRMDGLHERVAHWSPQFDGRLFVCAVDQGSGRRVVFGAPGAPPASVPDAVMASCAIPGAFVPIAIGGREYVDGGVWSLTNLDAAPARGGDRILCLDPAANPQASAFSAMGAVRIGAAAITGVEIAALGEQRASVDHVGPDRAAGALMAPSLMDPGPAERVLAAGYAQGRALAG